MTRDPQRLLVEERGWTRCRPVKAMFRPPEHDDLQAIAKAWGVPLATALWAIVVGELARYRRQAPELGEHGLAIAAASRVLRQKAQDTPPQASKKLLRGFLWRVIRPP